MSFLSGITDRVSSTLHSVASAPGKLADKLSRTPVDDTMWYERSAASIEEQSKRQLNGPVKNALNSGKNIVTGAGKKLVNIEKSIFDANSKGMIEAFKSGEQYLGSGASKIGAAKSTLANQGVMDTTIRNIVDSAKSAIPSTVKSIIPETGRIAGAIKFASKVPILNKIFLPAIATLQESEKIDLSKNSLGKEVLATGGGISGRVGGTLAGLAVGGLATAALVAASPVAVPGLAAIGIGLALGGVFGGVGNEIGGWVGRKAGNFLGNVGEATLGNIFEKP